VKYLERLNQFLLVLGIPGLFLITLIDSAVVPLGGGPDAIVLFLAWQRPDRIWLIAAAAASGSTLGCLLLYRLGRAGGERALAPFPQSTRTWVREKLASHSFWSVFIAVVIPPPFPTKPVILAAGVFHMQLDKFSTGVLAGRFIRYGTGAYLGAHLGKQAATVVRERSFMVLLIIAAAALSVFLFRRLRHGE
jgi:membrane protein YqaA with SNARE-associated domain